MSKLGRVMWAFEESVRNYDTGERPAFYVFNDAEKNKPRGSICSVNGGFQRVHVFAPHKLRELLEEAFEAGYDYGDGRSHMSFGTFMKELEK